MVKLPRSQPQPDHQSTEYLTISPLFMVAQLSQCMSFQFSTVLTAVKILRGQALTTSFEFNSVESIYLKCTKQQNQTSYLFEKS